jgi:hypothetical protein
MSTKTKEKRQVQTKVSHSGMDLLDEYTYNYPFDFESEWIPLRVCSERLKTDEKIVIYLLEQAGLKTDSGWALKFKAYGLIMEFRILEKDPTVGYQGGETITLVSSHGLRFLEEFLKL